MQDYLKNLNAAQYEAAVSIDGPLLILAGAGSGKTHTLVSRVMYMLENGIKPEQILLLTFTNKAAKEMQNRIIKRVGAAGDDITACTFHSFCATVIRHNASSLGISPGYAVIDSSDMTEAISIAQQEFLSVKKEHGIEYNLKDFPNKKAIAKVYEFASNNCVSFADAVNLFKDTDGYTEEVLSILKLFKEYKLSRNLMDYEDLLHYTEKLLKERKEFCKRLSLAYKYILVDEYQDTCLLQDRILDLLASAHNNIAVVGDDNQSIYKFRGARIENILTFSERHPGCKTVVLDTNYRSTQEILDFSNMMMSFSSEGIKKNLKGTFTGSKPKLTVVADSDEEARYVFNEIKKSGVPLKDIAVICRSSRQTYALENLLNMNGIPYNKFGGTKFLEKAVIKDLLAFVRLSVNIKDEIASYRLLQMYPGIGKTFAKKISEIIAKDGTDAAVEKYKKRQFAKYLEDFTETINKLSDMSLFDLLSYVVNNYYFDLKEKSINMSDMSYSAKSKELSAIKDEEEDAKVLLSMAEKYKSAAKFIEDIVLEATVDTDDSDKLNITTIHSAKGLEYDTVFVLDCINGVMPKGTAYEDYSEELRCMYVACTRAKRKLYLMAPKYYVPGHAEGKFSPFIDKKDILDTLDINVSGRELNSMRNPSEFSSCDDSLTDFMFA